MDDAIVFVCPCRGGEQGFNGSFDFLVCGVRVYAGLLNNAFCEFIGTCGKVLTEIIQDLCAGVTGGLGPFIRRPTRGFDSVADVLTITSTDFGNQVSIWIIHFNRIAAIWAGLFAVNEELGGTINGWEGRWTVDHG